VDDISVTPHVRTHIVARPVRVVSGWTLGGGGRVRELITLPWWLIVLGRVLRWFGVSHPLLTADGVGVVYVWIKTGSLALALATVAVVDVALLACLIAVLLRLTGASLSAIIAGMSRRRQLRRQWPDVAAAAGLVRTVRGDQAYPPLRRVRVTQTGLRAVAYTGRVGKTVEKAVLGRGAMAAVMGCREVYVRQGKHSGITSLEFAWGDPLKRTLRLRDLPEPTSRAHLTFGITEDQEPVSIERDLSTLIVGLTGSGKSSTVWAMLAALVKSGIPYRLVVVDPKGGMEMAALKDVAYKYAVMPEDIAQVLGDTVTEMRERMNTLGDRKTRKYKPTREHPFTLLVVDEFLSLTMFMNSKLKSRVEQSVGLLLTQGRAPGYAGLFCSQGSQVDALGRIRTFIPQRLCHATDDVETTVAALGSDARHSARCDKLNLRTQQGVGFMQVDGQRGFTRFRSVYVTDRETVMIANGQLPPDAYTGRGFFVPSRRDARRARRERVAVYRWVSHDEEVLYIGISSDPERRLGQHISDKPWVEEAARVELVEWCDSREDALILEEDLIRSEQPRYNIVHNMDNPGRVAYELEA
jgi:S-DNA-T family DNA segregation ATPase FtsK/SpoIIIE